MFEFTIRLEGLPKIISNGSQGSWRAKHFEKKKWSRAVADACYDVVRQNYLILPLKKAKIVLTRFSSKSPDFDGLVSSFKACIDGLKVGGVILDDNHSVVGQPRYKWVLARRLEGRVEIIVKGVKDKPTKAAKSAKG